MPLSFSEMYKSVSNKLKGPAKILRDKYRDIGEVDDFYQRYELFESRPDYVLIDAEDHFFMTRCVHHSIADMDDAGNMVNLIQVFDFDSPTPDNADTWLMHDYSGHLDQIWEHELSDKRKMEYAFFSRLLDGKSYARLMLVSEARRISRIMRKLKINEHSQNTQTRETSTTSQRNARNQAA